MPMKRTFTALLLSEYDRLRWRKKLRDFYESNGDWKTYALPPCIILSEGDYFDKKIDIGDGRFRIGGETEKGDISIVLRTEGKLPDYASPSAGLFITADPSGKYTFPEDEIKADTIALIEADDEDLSYRILRSRPLRMGI